MVKRSLLVVGLLAAGLLLSVRPANANILHYVVTGFGTATFDLQSNPTIASSTGQDFEVIVNNGAADLFGYNFPLPPFTLEFYNSTAGGGFGLVTTLGDFQLKGLPMFSGPDSAPTLSMGVFHLTYLSLYQATVTVTDPVPEPGTLVLLGSGLISLGIFRKRSGSR